MNFPKQHPSDSFQDPYIGKIQCFILHGRLPATSNHQNILHIDIWTLLSHRRGRNITNIYSTHFKTRQQQTQHRTQQNSSISTSFKTPGNYTSTVLSDICQSDSFPDTDTEQGHNYSSFHIIVHTH